MDAKIMKNIKITILYNNFQKNFGSINNLDIHKYN